jgi:hypothetical protein
MSEKGTSFIAGVVSIRVRIWGLKVVTAEAEAWNGNTINLLGSSFHSSPAFGNKTNVNVKNKIEKLKRKCAPPF